MTSFDVEKSGLSSLELRRVGSSEHLKYWVPADELSTFNAAIRGLARVVEGYFGTNFVGDVPDNFILKGTRFNCPICDSTKNLGLQQFRTIGGVNAELHNAYLTRALTAGGNSKMESTSGS